MKYTNEIVINAPLEKVIKLFDDPEKLKEWQEGLQSFEHISGTPGQPGAQSKLVFQMGKRRIEMIETITVRDLPREFSGTYDAAGVHNIVRNFFSAVDANTTKYVSESEFQFKGFMRMIGLIMPGAFKKQPQKYLEDFKSFVERS